jgi:poly-gamma-glutamate capsule biosynthesis protein CapA/YwtB (metallophosphatase superfamily)
MRSLLQPHAGAIFTGLETAILPSGGGGDDDDSSEPPAEPQRSTVFFHAAPAAVLDCLQSMGVNLLATANNHVGDLGEAGILALLKECDARQICHAGVGRDAQSAALPAHAGRIAHVCFASKIPDASAAMDDPPRAGVNALAMADVERRILHRRDLERVVRSIGLARSGSGRDSPPADVVIAYHHNHYWEKDAPVNVAGSFGSWKRRLAHRLIDAGASVYVAHGDPRLQGIEMYNGCPIFYCLGNFLFQTKTAVAFYGAEVWESVLVELHFDPVRRTAASVKLVPLVLNEVGETEATHFQTRGLPKLADRLQGLAILRRLQEMSDAFGTAIRIEDAANKQSVCGWVLIDEPREGRRPERA